MHFVKSKLLNTAVFKKQLSLNGDKPLPIKPFKTTIKAALESLEEHQNLGVSSADLVKNYTWMIDELVKIIWQHFDHLATGKKPELIAVGGYGRGELHPKSDIDLLILLADNNYDSISEFVEHFIRFLWDIGLEIGHSVRSVKDCVKEARGDITIMTNLLESRRICGANDLLTTVDTKIRGVRTWSPTSFFNGKVEEQVARHRQYQDTAYSLEPNLKESPGGLRDLQTILWVYNRHYGVRSFKEMNDQGLISNSEYKLLIRARNILWKIRIGLHLLTNRHEDRLLFDTQRQLAEEFGYQDTSSRLAVEQLMKRFYRTVKDVIYLNEVLLANYRISHSKRNMLAVGRNINDNFIHRNKLIEQREPDLFSKQPEQMLMLFTLMQDHKISGIHPDTIRSIRANLKLITNDFRERNEPKKLFLKLFKHHGVSLTNILMRMNAYGLLGAYLPNFGAIVGQMQHDLFHVYTVDGHTLKVIDNLVQLRQNPEEFPIASKILENLYKPERLLLGALFHDIAKGRGGDHSELGEADAYDFCISHGLSVFDGKLVGWLVLNHLRMSHFSQRRDISDPQVIKEFADIVGDIEHLDNLYLLTLADIRGTSPKVWNAWKGQLLLDLYNATRAALRQGVSEPHNVEEHVADDQAEAIALLKSQLGDNAIQEKQLQQFWNTLPNDYFIRNEPYYIAWHASSLIKTKAITSPLISIRFSERLQANMFFIFAPETNRLLTQVTGSFDALELNIIEARLQSAKNGFTLYTFNAVAPAPDLAKQRDYMAHLEEKLRELILTDKPSQAISRQNASRVLKHFPIKPSIKFLFNRKSYTTMEVIAQDQPGLLHNVAMILRELGLVLLNAKVATFGERAEDVFYIRHSDHAAVTDTKILAELENRIITALDQPESNQN